MSSSNRQIVLRQRPGAGSINPTLNSGTFELKSSPVPSSLKDNQILVRLLYCSLDPAMRGWLNDARSYLPPVQIGEVMRAAGLGVVVKSKSKNFKEGDHVAGTFGWQEYAVVKDSQATKLDMSTKGVELLDFLGPLGSSGQTAYWVSGSSSQNAEFFAHSVPWLLLPGHDGRSETEGRWASGCRHRRGRISGHYCEFIFQ